MSTFTEMVIQMRSRKILVTAVIGLLLISVVAPVVAFGESECEPTGIEDCTWQDWLVWLAEYFVWIMSRPDGPPPVPSCLVE
jgi:hypothetical protein